MQIEAAMVGWSSPEHDLFPWLDMDGDHLVTFEEAWSIYKTILEDGQVSFFFMKMCVTRSHDYMYVCVCVCVCVYWGLRVGAEYKCF